MKDFTLKKYTKLLNVLQRRGYFIFSFEQFVKNPKNKIIVLRHDVDRLPDNSLKTARIEHDLGIKGTYYFRAVSESYDENIIKQIVDLGHEIGYHYENLSGTMNDDWRLLNKKKGRLEARNVEKRNRMSDVREQVAEGGRMEIGKVEPRLNRDKLREIPKKKLGGDGSIKNFKSIDEIPSWIWEMAITPVGGQVEDFRINLEKFREIYPVKTICMHGSPLSKYDNRLLWEKYDYRDFGIIGEPYFDIDFSEVLYLTDTGRRWDGVSLRDKVSSREYEVSRKKLEARRQKSEDRGQRTDRLSDLGTKRLGDRKNGRLEGWKNRRKNWKSEETKRRREYGTK